mgnify:CR=1 FL=1
MYIISQVRKRIIESLASYPKTAYDIAKEIRVDVSTVYRNLDVMGKEGLITLLEMEPYKGRFKKKYILTFKAIYLFYDIIHNKLPTYSITVLRYIAKLFDVPPTLISRDVEKRFQMSWGDPERLEKEHLALKQFIKENNLPLDYLNDIEIFFAGANYTLKWLKERGLNKLLLKHLEWQSTVMEMIKSDEKILKKILQKLRLKKEGILCLERLLTQSSL